MQTAMAKHILVKSEAEARRLLDKLHKGDSFDALAKKHSTCPSGRRGGDLGEVKPGQMAPAIDKLVFKGALKKTHGPVKSKFGYHLLQVYFRS